MLKPRIFAVGAAAVLLASVFAPPAGAQSDDEVVVVRVGLHAAEKSLNPFIVPQGPAHHP